LLPQCSIFRYARSARGEAVAVMKRATGKLPEPADKNVCAT
jgi:hypothetical protein